MTAAEFNKLTTTPFRLLRPSLIDIYFNLIQQGHTLLRLVAGRRRSVLDAKDQVLVLFPASPSMKAGQHVVTAHGNK